MARDCLLAGCSRMNNLLVFSTSISVNLAHYEIVHAKVCMGGTLYAVAIMFKQYDKYYIPREGAGTLSKWYIVSWVIPLIMYAHG